jgi:hypothetical protein
MGFCPSSLQNHDAAREKWICKPGSHIVEIVGYQRTSKGRGGEVTFELRDDQGRKQTAWFSLSVPVLRSGRLLSFVIAANNWRAVEHQGAELSVANVTTWRRLVGQRIEILVKQDDGGYHRVVDWRSVEPVG